MTKNAMVTVIVPCYNYGHFLGETLHSVSNQTHRDLECIIVDDGSTDNTKDVAEAFIKKDNRFHYIYQQNQGLSAARNTGIKVAKGDWIQFLDADDLIHHRKLELQLRFASAPVVFSAFKYFNAQAPDLDAEINDEPSVHNYAPKEAMKLMLRKNIMVVNAPLVRTEAIRATGTFDTTYKSLEDWNFWFRMSLKGISFMDVQYTEPMVFVRSHNASMSRNSGRMLKAHDQLIDFVRPQLDRETNRLFTKESRHYKGAIIFEEIQTGNLPTGLSLALQAMIQSPANISWFMRNILYSLKVRMRK